MAEEEVSKQPKKEKSKWRMTIIVASIVAFIILCIIIYYGTRAQPVPVQQSNGTDTSVNQVLSSGSNGSSWIIGILIVALAVTAGYLFYTNKEKIFSADVIREIYPDKAFEIFKKNVSRKYNLNVYFGEKGNIVSDDPQEFFVWRHWPFKKFEDGWLLIEFEMVSGLARGIATAIIPLSLGEDAIEYGATRLTVHSPFNSYKANFRTYPVGSSKDREQRLLTTLFDAGSELGPEQAELIKKLASTSRSQSSEVGSLRLPGQFVSKEEFYESQQSGEISDEQTYEQYTEQRKKRSKRA